MAIFDKAVCKFDSFRGYKGNPPTEAEYDTWVSNPENFLQNNDCIFEGSVPTWSEIQTKITEVENEAQAKEDLKASAKAKLMAGEPLTEAEANYTLHIFEE